MLAIAPHHDVQNDTVISRVMVVAMRAPVSRAYMDLYVAPRYPPTDVHDRVLKVRTRLAAWPPCIKNAHRNLVDGQQSPASIYRAFPESYYLRFRYFFHTVRNLLHVYVY